MRSRRFNRWGYSGAERVMIQRPARCHFSSASPKAPPRSRSPSNRDREMERSVHFGKLIPQLTLQQRRWIKIVIL